MSGVKLRLTCLVWPDDMPNEHLVEVKIDEDEQVMVLKELIKDGHPHSLAHLDSRELILWKCSGLPDGEDDLEQTLKTLQFDGSDDRLVRLSARRSISQYFGDEDLSKEPIHILVELQALGECVTHVFYSRPRLDRYLCALLV